jgi:hypothetical protein
MNQFQIARAQVILMRVGEEQLPFWMLPQNKVGIAAIYKVSSPKVKY